MALECHFFVLCHLNHEKNHRLHCRFDLRFDHSLPLLPKGGGGEYRRESRSRSGGYHVHSEREQQETQRSRTSQGFWSRRRYFFSRSQSVKNSEKNKPKNKVKPKKNEKSCLFVHRVRSSCGPI